MDGGQRRNVGAMPRKTERGGAREQRGEAGARERESVWRSRTVALSPRRRARASSPQTQCQLRRARGDGISGDAGACLAAHASSGRNKLHPHVACPQRRGACAGDTTAARTPLPRTHLTTMHSSPAPRVALLLAHHTATAVVLRMLERRRGRLNKKNLFSTKKEKHSRPVLVRVCVGRQDTPGWRPRRCPRPPDTAAWR